MKRAKRRIKVWAAKVEDFLTQVGCLAFFGFCVISFAIGAEMILRSVFGR